MNHPSADQIADLVGGELGAGENRKHARHFGGRFYVDRLDRRVGMRRPQKICVNLPRPIDIVGVVARSSDEAAVFLAAHWSADTGCAHGPRPPGSSLSPMRPLLYSAAFAAAPPRMARAPAAIALTMLW